MVAEILKNSIWYQDINVGITIVLKISLHLVGLNQAINISKFFTDFKQTKNISTKFHLLIENWLDGVSSSLLGT